MPSDDDEPKPSHEARAVHALRTLIAHPTIAGEGHDPAPFAAFATDLTALFPALFAACETTRIDEAFLIRWPGTSDDPPLVLMAHIDVVPPGPQEDWTHPPFDLTEVDGMLYGRGTLDCKGSLVAICAAVEGLIEQGVRPRRDVWLSFGSNEEVSGDAAPRAVEALRERGVEPWFVLDEGGAVVTEAIPGLREPVALVGVTEKGLVDLDLVATGAGGHASMPPKGGATARLARAITRLEDHPAPSSLPQPAREMLTRVAPRLTQPMRFALTHALKTEPVLARLLARIGPETAAMTRTTLAVTRLSASPARNVLATSATASVNMRVLVGESVDQAIERVRQTIKDDRVDVRLVHGYEPSPVAPSDDDAFALIEATCGRILPDAFTAPYIVMAATDARHFQRAWPRCYRFNPFRMTSAQRDSIHNVDERLARDSFIEAIRWYTDLLEHL